MTIVNVNGVEKCFIHFHKSAGSSFNWALGNKYKLVYCLNHQPSYNLPPSYKSIKQYSIVRNPLTWYKSFYSYFVSLLKEYPDVSIVNNELTASLLLNDNNIISFDEFLTRAFNINDYVNYENITKLEKNSINLLASLKYGCKNLNKALKQIDSSNSFFMPMKQYIESHKNEKLTLYSLFIETIGIRDTIYFRMEDEIDEICEIFDIDCIPHDRKSDSKNITLSKSRQQEIINLDREYFELFGYNVD